MSDYPVSIRCVVSAAAAVLLACVAGCQKEGVKILTPPLASLRQAPVIVVIESARMSRQEYLLEGESNSYKAVPPLYDMPWINAARFSTLMQSYFEQAQLFAAVSAEPPKDGGSYLVCRPHIRLKGYARPSVSGTVLTVGTGLIYNILGGSTMYRREDCELVLELETPSGRPVGRYTATCRSAERLVTDAPQQLGPLISYVFTKTLEDAVSQVSVDNDLIMRAMSADMTAKGVVPVVDSPMRIVVQHPKGIIVRGKSTPLTGQVVGIDRPIVLEWTVNGVQGENVALRASSAASVKDFSLQVPLQEGVDKIVLTVRPAAGELQPAAELARTEIAYLCVSEDKSLPEIRQRWAVVIGISQYAHGGQGFSNLKYSDKDAKAFYDFLVSPRSGGFATDHVLCLLNEQATVANVRGALFEFLAKAGRDDLVVIFFSGHGMPQAGSENFFMLCHDTLPDHLASTSFPMWDIDTALRRFVKAERVVVLADACHAGEITAPGVKGGGENPVHQYLQQLALAEPGRLVFTASEARELSYESDKLSHGTFTYYLLQGLSGAADADRDGVVTAGELVEYVRANVVQASGGKQHPYPGGQYDRKLPLAVVQTGP